MAAGIGRGFGTEWVKIGAIKVFLDGGMSSRTAAVSKPYAHPPGIGKGILNDDQKGINREIEKFDQVGYQVSVHEAYGHARSQELYPFATLLRRGIKLALSSDCSVAERNPLIGVRDAICRRTPSGQDLGVAECITVEQAIALYTREASYFSFEENERGNLKEGKVADLAVLNKDPLQLSPDEIPNCRVKMTVVGGRIVYDAR